MNEYWKIEDKDELQKAVTYEELAQIALRILGRMPQPIAQVCGPISTGGLGSIEENMKVFQETIQGLVDKGVTVFNQMPFEEPMFRIVRPPYNKGQPQLLELFYLPIFESGFVNILYFMSQWDTS